MARARQTEHQVFGFARRFLALLALVALVATAVIATPESASAQETEATTVLGQGRVDSGPSAPHWTRVDFQVNSANDYTINLDWDSNAELYFSVFSTNPRVRVGTTFLTDSPGEWSGELVNTESYYLGVWSIDGAANFTATLTPAPTTVEFATGTVDSTGVAASNWARVDFPAFSTGIHTITLDWDSNAELYFSVISTNPKVRVGTTNGTNTPGQWTGHLDTSTSYYIGLWAENGIADYTVSIAGVLVEPIITSQPQDQSVEVGGTAIFSATAIGIDPLSYQWFRNGVAIAGATGPTLRRANVPVTGDGAIFRVLVTDATGIQVPSDPARLSVASTNPPIDIGQGVLDFDRVVGVRTDRINFDVVTDGIHTIDLETTGDADVFFSVFTTSPETKIATTVRSQTPGQWTGRLAADSEPFVRVFSTRGSTDYQARLTGPEPTPPGIPYVVEDKVLNYGLWDSPQDKRNGFRAPISGPITIDLEWDSDADFDLVIRRENFSELASDTSRGTSRKSVTFDADADSQYYAYVVMHAGSDTNWVLRKIQDIPDPNFGITDAPDNGGRPNIVLINTDDQRADTLHLLPYVQEFLVDRGVTFTNAIVPTPSCCPSRATLLSGQYVHNNGQFGQQTPNTPIFEQTIQKFLHQAGYFTGTAGKYLHWVENDDPVPPYWDGWTNIKGGFYGVGANFDGVRQTVGGYTTDIVFERTKEYLRGFERENDNKPWFVYLAPLAPHSPFTAEYDLRNEPVAPYDPGPAYQEADISDKPAYLPFRSMDEATAEWYHEQRVRSLYSVDREIRELVEYLELSGELDNTMIVFTSDNGYILGEHQTVGKFVPWRQSVEVPLVVSWPGNTTPGTVSDNFVSHVDISRTILEAARVNTTNIALDGVNLFDNDRDIFYMEYFRDLNNSGRIDDWASIRTDEFQYSEWYAEGTNNVIFREYYDMIADPHQLNNLLWNGDRSDNPDVRELAAHLRAQRTCTRSTCTTQNPFD